MKPRLTELLKAVKPERALFTTYTLSLSWFESFCLPILRADGCEQIDLLVDSKEACKAGAETASAYAGNAFWVTPVAMEKAGIFHPKIAYLQGSSDDTLVIGSGNLTQPGQGGNLEIIDSVNSSAHPHVFEEFANFADLFLNRTGLSPHVVSTLKSYASRARQVALKASEFVRNSPRSAWLVHTLQTPAHEQLGVLVEQQLINPSRITVFSPFHSRSAEAVGRLATRCQVRQMRIALLPKWLSETNEHCYIAPFDQNAPHLPKTHSFVRAVTGLTPRPVHAKCIEIEGSDAVLILAGSINATRQSLCETRNVEVGLVRKLERSPFEWERAEPDEYEPCEYDAEDDSGPRLCVEAELNEQRLRGRLLPNAAERVVSVELWSRNRCEKALPNVSVARDGSFSVTVDGDLDTEYALRIKLLDADQLLATGWLNVEAVLAFPPINRNLAQAAANIASGKPSERDLRAILEHFRRILKRAQRDAATEEVNIASRTTVTVPELLQKTGFDQWSPDELRALGVSPKTARQILAAAFASLRKPVGGPARGRIVQETEDEDVCTKDAVNEAERAVSLTLRSQKRQPHRREPPENPLAEMLNTLPLVLRINATGVWIPGLVAVSFSEYLQSNLNAMRTLPGDGEPDYASLGPLLKQWFTEFCRYDYGEANRMRLLPLFCGVAACTVFFGGETVNPPKVKQNLETFVRRTLNADEWLEFADDALGTPPFAALDEQMRAKVLEGALTLAESLATHQELEELVVAVFSGSANALKFPRHKGVYGTLDLLHRNLIRSKKKNRIFGILGVAVNPFELKIGCPACNERLNDLDFMNQLTRDGVAIHTPNCNKPIFVGLSRETLVAARIPAWAYGYTDD